MFKIRMDFAGQEFLFDIAKEMQITTRHDHRAHLEKMLERENIKAHNPKDTVALVEWNSKPREMGSRVFQHHQPLCTGDKLFIDGQEIDISTPNQL